MSDDRFEQRMNGEVEQLRDLRIRLGGYKPGQPVPGIMLNEEQCGIIARGFENADRDLAYLRAELIKVTTERDDKLDWLFRNATAAYLSLTAKNVPPGYPAVIDAVRLLGEVADPEALEKARDASHQAFEDTKRHAFNEGRASRDEEIAGLRKAYIAEQFALHYWRGWDACLGKMRQFMALDERDRVSGERSRTDR